MQREGEGVLTWWHPFQDGFDNIVRLVAGAFTGGLLCCSSDTHTHRCTHTDRHTQMHTRSCLTYLGVAVFVLNAVFIIDPDI